MITQFIRYYAITLFFLSIFAGVVAQNEKSIVSPYYASLSQGSANGFLQEKRLISDTKPKDPFSIEGVSNEFIISITLQSVLLGIFLSMFLYLLLMYFMNPDSSLLFYNLYTLSLICLIFIHPSNELFRIILLKFPGSRIISEPLELLSGAGVVIFYLLFCIHVAHKKNWRPRIRRLLYFLVYAFIIDLLLALLPAAWEFKPLPSWASFLAFLDTIRTIFFFGAMSMILYIIIVYILAKDKLVQFLGWSSFYLAIGGTVFSLIDHEPGLLPDPVYNYRFFQIMCILQLVAFAIFLNYRGRQIEREKAQLQALDMTKSRFFANISHEFRTPLTLILGPVSDLLKENQHPKRRLQLKFIHKNAKRLLKLVNQILDLSKLDAGQVQLNAQPGDLVRFSRQIAMSFSTLAENRKIQLFFEAEPDEIWMDFDRDHLEKIILNLVSNAVKYTPEGGRVHVRLNADSNKGQVLLQVADTGIGIPEELLPRIFDRFYQASSSDHITDLPSTGIGLALTKELVELHGGSIEVKSLPHKGSEFLVAIPFKKVEPLHSSSSIKPDTSSIEADSKVAVHQEKTDHKSGKPLVLVIEDNEDVLAYIQSTLIDDFQIIAAADGKTGVEKAIAQVPDLIITDVMMPRKDGFMVTSELKAHEMTSHIPIIILTGKSSHDSKLKGLKIDADEYLTKPFDAAELRIRIQGLLRNRRRLQAHFSKNLLLKPDQTKITSREEAFLQKVIAVIDQNLSNENFTVEALGQTLFLDRTQLYRKLRALTDKSPSRFIRSYRLQHARHLLEGDAGTVSEIAFNVGFCDVAYFSRCFKEEFGYSPSDAKPKKVK